MAENEQQKPRLVQAPGEFNAPEGDEKRTASARQRFVARPHDGIWTPAQQNRSEPASREDQVAAFGEYVERPDIESRESILARENALPAQLSDGNVGSGAVDDGLKGGKEDEGAKKEAASIGDVTAKKGK